MPNALENLDGVLENYLKKYCFTLVKDEQFTTCLKKKTMLVVENVRTAIHRNGPVFAPSARLVSSSLCSGLAHKLYCKHFAKCQWYGNITKSVNRTLTEARDAEERCKEGKILYRQRSSLVHDAQNIGRKSIILN